MDSPVMGVVKGHRSTQTRLHGVWMWIARGVWIILVLPVAVPFLFSLPGYYRDLLALKPVGDVFINWTAEGVRTAVTDLGLSPGLLAGISVIRDLVFVLTCWIVALLIFWRKSDEWMGLIVSFMLVGMGPAFASAHVEVAGLPVFWQGSVIIVNVLVVTTFMICLYVFPDGQFVPRWTWFIPIPAFLIIYNLVMFYDQASNTLNLPWWVIVPGLAVPIGGVASQIHRYVRISTPLQRQQTKWFLWAMAIFVVARLPNVLLLSPGLSNSAAALVFSLLNRHLLQWLAEMFIPISLTIALFRYRLWDVDFIINRSLVYGAVTLILGGAFAGLFFGARAILSATLGAQNDLIAAVIPAVAVTAVFTPARRMLRELIDRRMYGIKLDYVEAAKAYGGTKKDVAKTADTKSSFGSYSGLTLLGRGGMGEVYLAQHPTLNRSVAIKILPENVAGKEDAKKRFVREAQTVARLKHPNIISLHDVGEQDGKPFMVMEYIDGKDLSDIIHERGRLPLAEALPILADIAAALDYAHQNGVIHRDIKPSNVMVETPPPVPISKSGEGQMQARPSRAVLMDFGIAKSYAAVTKLTQSGMIGTLDYISPEQIQGASEVDARADIYSLGVMAYQMLTGNLPFEHNNPGAMVLAHIMQPAPDPRDIARDVPESAALAVIRAMAKKPEQRFSSAGELVAAMTA